MPGYGAGEMASGIPATYCTKDLYRVVGAKHQNLREVKEWKGMGHKVAIYFLRLRLLLSRWPIKVVIKRLDFK
jgi:hypothetical protein